VTLQQLQLAVCALAHADGIQASGAALLLALLLQRAGPGLRAEFLGGAGGTTLLAACQYWGYRRTQTAADFPTLPMFSLYGSVRMTPGDCSAHLMAALQGALHEDVDLLEWSSPVSIGLVLVWCYLQPCPGWEAQLPAGLLEVVHQQHMVASTTHAVQTSGSGADMAAGEATLPRGHAMLSSTHSVMAGGGSEHAFHV
jgi:hypothetical protein